MKHTLIKLTAPEGATSVHHDGEDFEVKNGTIEVPEQIVTDLKASHGYKDHAPAAPTKK